jgi:large subunit ribosomal protein L24
MPDQVKTRIRRNDTVQVIAGREGGKRHIAEGEDPKLRGKRGKVLEVDRERGRALVEGLNLVYKHQRRSQDPSQPNAGRIEIEAPIRLSNLMLVCPECDKATRIGVRVEEGQDADGNPRQRRVRVCKGCGATIAERVG